VATSGVRDGGGRPPRPEKFRENSVFRASTSCSKILKDKKYFNTVKNSRADSVFQGKRRLFKILNDKKDIFNTVNSGHTLFFRASTSCSKILNEKTIFNTVKNFRENSVFRARASYSKILISMQWKFSRQTLFSRASASCSKFWRIKNTFNTVNSGHTLFFRASKSCSNILNVKGILNTAKNFMTNSFSGQAQVPQKSWKIKIFQCNEEFQGKL